MIPNKFLSSLITMASVRTVFFHVLLTVIIPFMWIHPGKCSSSFLAESSHKQTELNEQYHEYPTNGNSDMENVVPACELVYKDYLEAIENFTHCEIHHVTPFRLCLECLKHYHKMANLFAELNNNPLHEECKQKYMMSDIVQIIPTVQANMDKMWRSSHCRRCYTRNDTMRERVSTFLTLYKSFNVCINGSVAEEMKRAWADDENVGNSTDPCIRCKSPYAALNANFNAMYNADKGDVCMDIMNMMNYTRIMWSSQFNCTPSSYDSTPVIVISCIVACTPILFYVYLRINGKVQRSRLFKSKRLATSTESSNTSHSTTDSSHSSG